MAMADEIVFDMSSQSEGTPSVFTKKDWLSILDNQNQNYQGNQSVIDTSQLANSNKFLNYREAYLTVPMVLTVTQTPTITGGTTVVGAICQPASAGQNIDYAVGLKNWYGSIVHSFTVDYNGTTIIQQTPYIGLWNSFKLMTSLSLDDLITQGSSIGFYPDSASAVGVTLATATSGTTYTTVNNANIPLISATSLTSQFNVQTTYNDGFLRRQRYTMVDPDGIAGAISAGSTFGALQQGGSAYASGVSTANNWTLLWKGYIFNKTNAVTTTTGGLGVTYATITGNNVFQVAITAQIYLKHLHAFFERIPLLKGIFMKLTLNLNQTSVNFTTTTVSADTNVLPRQTTWGAVSVQSPLGGVSPIMLASGAGSATGWNGGCNWGNGSGIVSLSVGPKCLNSTQIASTTAPVNSPLSGSILLNVPAYSFNPVFESSYLSSPVKKIIYTDVYQYQVLNITAGAVYNNLITNGIANIKSVLVLPFYNAGTVAGVTNNGTLIPFQSPFDPAGGGPTSPQCLMTQFNIQISGQNAIYNTERYEYEQFMNQFKGVNSMNGGQEDGCSSGLVGQYEFDSEYCYYYVNCGRMLPVEEAVPKSVNILGTNTSGKNVDLYIFVEYGVEVNVDILTGARV
jgi:hypothetical protein